MVGIEVFETKGRNELKSLQAGRGLAALAVVLFHANGTIGAPKYFGAAPAPWAAAGDSGVHFFFVLSGMLMVLVHWSDIGSGATPYTFWWKRLRRIVPPLWIALCFASAGLVLTPGGFPTVWALVRAFLIFPVDEKEILTVEWTLRHEMVFYALFGLLIWRWRIGAGLLGAWFFASLLPSSTVPEALRFWTSPYHILFLIGCLTGVAIRREIPRRAPLAWLGFGAAGFAGFYAAKILELDLPALGWMAGFGLSAATILVAAVRLERTSHLRIWPLFELLGNASYSIYLVHYPMLSLLAKMALSADSLFHYPPWIWFVILVSLSIVGGVAFYLCIERPVMKLFPTRLNLSTRRVSQATASTCSANSAPDPSEIS